MALDLVIGLDSTGSLASCIAQVKRGAENLVNRLFTDLDGLRISVSTFGNYCDNPIIENIPFSSDKDKLCKFIRGVSATGGGGQRNYRGSWCTACYELVMRDTAALDWRDGAKKVLILVGDENPSCPSYGVDWEVELKKLADLGVNVYGVHCLNLNNTRESYQEVARRTDGIMMPLNQFADIIDLLLAIGYKTKSPEALEQFELELKLANRMNRSMAAAFSALSGKVVEPCEFKSAAVVAGTLEPVDPATFQVLDVDHDYGTCRLKPYDVPSEYTAFIQSTSVNRQLLPKTKFLYKLNHI